VAEQQAKDADQGKFSMNKKNTARNILEKELSFQA
jgi:hypothetical protein